MLHSPVERLGFQSTFQSTKRLFKTLLSQVHNTSDAKWKQWLSEMPVYRCIMSMIVTMLSGRFNYEWLVPYKQYFASTYLAISSCASYVSRTHDVVDEVTRSQSRSIFQIDISPSTYQLQCRSKAKVSEMIMAILLAYSTSVISSGKNVCRELKMKAIWKC